MHETQSKMTDKQGIITHMGLLDLRHLNSVDELANVKEIAYVGTILIPERLQGNIAGIPMHHIGSIVAIPDGMKITVLSGDVKLRGEFLEHKSGDPDETLLVSGELTITSPFVQVGFKSIIVTGELFAPKPCEPALAASISQLYGEVHFYSHEPRMFTGQDRFGSDFFTYLKQPVSLFLRGEFAIEDDVSPELLHEKVAELYLWGSIRTADRKQAGLLQAVTALKYGDISPERA